MRIKELASNDWKICSPIVSDDDFTDIEIYINANQADKSLTNAMAAIDRLSKFGSRGFTDSSVHEVNQSNDDGSIIYCKD